MDERKKMIAIMIVSTLIGVMLSFVLAWFGGRWSFSYIETSIAKRREQRQRLFDLQGPQEAYRHTLEEDVDVIFDLEEDGFSDLFLMSDDVLSFVLNVEELANRTGVHHTISDRGITVPSGLRRSPSVEETIEHLSPAEKIEYENLLARQTARPPDIDSLPSRSFVIGIKGSFDGVTRFIGMMEESLPLVEVDSFTLQREELGSPTPEEELLLPPSLRGFSANVGMDAGMEVRVFLKETN